MNRRGPHFLYRLYAGKRCLYVGRTNNLQRRLIAHSYDKPWWPQVDRVEHEVIPTYVEARDAETFLIRHFDPPYNILGRGHLVDRG